MKTMVAELTDSTNIAQGLILIETSLSITNSKKYRIKAFAFMPVVFSIGATIGYRNYFFTSS
jgi:hypothetical protein